MAAGREEVAEAREVVRDAEEAAVAEATHQLYSPQRRGVDMVYRTFQQITSDGSLASSFSRVFALVV